MEEEKKVVESENVSEKENEVKPVEEETSAEEVLTIVGYIIMGVGVVSGFISVSEALHHEDWFTAGIAASVIVSSIGVAFLFKVIANISNTLKSIDKKMK